MGNSSTIIEAIKHQLRRRGITYQALAKHLQVSEPTVKRDLARGNFTLARLDSICEILGVSIAELANTEPDRDSLLSELTEEQERALVGNPKLLLLTYLIVNQWKTEEILATFQIDENGLVSLLLALDELGIVRFRPPSGVQPLTARNFSWRKDGPVHEFFVQRVAPEFLRGKFDGAGDEFLFIGGRLSRASLTRFKSALARVATEFEALARADAKLPLVEREGCTALLAVRGWEFSEFTRLRRTRTAERR
jgi:transcriptional regulator with XRE-family HTH domain